MERQQRKFVCLKEAAELLGVDTRTVKKILLYTNKIHYKRVGRKILISIDDIMRYMTDNCTPVEC